MRTHFIALITNKTGEPLPTKVICSHCAHVEENVMVMSEDIYFPNRSLRGKNGNKIACSKCEETNDLTIFGEQYAGMILRPELSLLPQVMENNRIFFAYNTIEALEWGIKLRDKRRILEQYESVESEDFDWDDYPQDLFDQWNALVDKANEILYE